MDITIDDLVNERLVVLDLAARDRNGAIDEMAARLEADGRLTDRAAFTDVVRAREETGPTGMEMGVAIPHGKSPAVTQASIVVARSDAGVDFGAEDAPSRLLFLIAAPDGTEDLHVTLLARLARRLVHEEFRQQILDAPDTGTVLDVLRREVTL